MTTNQQGSAVARAKEGNLTRNDLVPEIARVCEIPQVHADVVLTTILESITDAIRKGERVEIRRFGTFSSRNRGPRVGRHPLTGNSIDVPAKRVAVFKPSRELLDIINGHEDGSEK
ncbi:MAG: HU family DNA-binding protein [Bryobacteraceae bacterium]